MSAEENIFHIIVRAEPQPFNHIGIGAFYISESELRAKYSDPYVSGIGFFLNGFSIKRDDVKRLVIMKSTPSGKGGLTLGKKRPNPEDVASWESLLDELLVFWDDVTDEFISGIVNIPVETEFTTQEIHSQRDKVFIVHGRDHITKTAMSVLLREVGLEVITWEKAKSFIKRGSPFTLDVVKRGIAESDAVVVLVTPDDEGRTRSEFENQVNGADSDGSPLFGQARQNVIYEAGMAFGVKPESTVIVEFGSVRSLSDLDGLQVIRMRSADKEVNKEQLLNALRNAGLTFAEKETDWLSVDFKLERFDQFSETQLAPQKSKTEFSRNTVALGVLETMSKESASDNFIDKQTIHRYHEILTNSVLDEDSKQGLKISESHYEFEYEEVPIYDSMGDEIVGYESGNPEPVLSGSIFRSKLREAIETIKQSGE
ncbi:MAG: nucleotide-binding protein [candidate division Zixibacteria bacterium]|nr:nucleotide-binding protein [candidate division Zixibacteria bacterium]